MRIYSTFVLLSLLACPAMATLNINMCLPDANNTPLALRDPNVPHDYREIMVGTKLCIIVGSDNKKKTSGMIYMSWADLEKGEFAVRDSNDLSGGSILAAAGLNAGLLCMYDWDYGLISEFNSGNRDIFPGKWFAWNYQAEDVGTCQVVLVEGLSVPDPKITNFVSTPVTLHHVASRDFNSDSLVNFKDFALFAQQWRTRIYPDPNGVTSPTDLDADGYVAVYDLSQFCRFWLKCTDVRVLVADPNASSSPPQP